MPTSPTEIKSPLLGAHFSIAGGYHHALLTAEKLHCNCLQIFLKNQRQWKSPDPDPEGIDLWHQTRQRLADQIHCIVGHGGYLINLASDLAANRDRSRRALADEMARCRLLGIDRLVIHPGSHRGQGASTGIRHIVRALDRIQPDFPDVTILLENTSGAGASLGSTIGELARIIHSARYPDRLGLCLDTCHLFATGLHLSPDQAIKEILNVIDVEISPGKIGCLHLNDSVDHFGSHRDRHAHIGKGQIGIGPFRCIMNLPQLQHIPKCLETPKGPDNSLAFDRRNLKVLRSLFIAKGSKNR